MTRRRTTNRWTGATGSVFRIKRDPAKLLGSAVARSTQPLSGFYNASNVETHFRLVSCSHLAYGRWNQLLGRLCFGCLLRCWIGVVGKPIAAYQRSAWCNGSDYWLDSATSTHRVWAGSFLVSHVGAAVVTSVVRYVSRQITNRWTRAAAAVSHHDWSGDA